MATDWTNFFLAQLGASAALLGFLFVSVSLNLKKILSHTVLSNMALMAMLLLLTILTVSSLLLIPNQSILSSGVMIVGVGLLICAIATSTGISNIRRSTKNLRVRFINTFVFNEITTLLYLVAGLIVLDGQVAGYYWLAAAIILSTILAVIDAWVLLVEINR